MKTEELQKYLDEKYPDIYLTANTLNNCPIIYVTGHIGYNFNMRVGESVRCADERLLEALTDVKKLIECSIEKIQGE